MSFIHKIPAEAVPVEAAPIGAGKYIEPSKGAFKELVVMDLDEEEMDTSEEVVWEKDDR